MKKANTQIDPLNNGGVKITYLNDSHILFKSLHSKLKINFKIQNVKDVEWAFI